MAATQMTFILDKPAIYNDELVNFNKYSKFTSVREFDQHWEMLMTTYKNKFSAGQHRVLRLIRQHSITAPGVCNASYRHLNNEHIKTYGTSVSRDTWRLAVDKAESFGLCQKHSGLRLIKGRNSRTANVVIFNRYEEVRAYEIAQTKKQEQEIERLLEEEFAQMSPTMNYAFNAMQWAQEKNMKEAQKKADQERKERKIKEQEQKAKKQSLYIKIKSYIASSKNKEQVKLNEFIGIAYGSVKKMTKEANVTQVQAEEIAFENFVKAINTKKVKKTHAALYSWLMTNTLNMLLGKSKNMTKGEIMMKQGKKVGVIPQFMIDNETDPIKKAELQREKEGREEQVAARTRENTPDWFQEHMKEQKLREQEREQENERRMLKYKNLTPEEIEKEGKRLLEELNK